MKPEQPRQPLQCNQCGGLVEWPFTNVIEHTEAAYCELIVCLQCLEKGNWAATAEGTDEGER